MYKRHLKYFIGISVPLENTRKIFFCWTYSWKYLLCENNSLKWKIVFGSYDKKMGTLFTNVFLKLIIFITSTYWILTLVSNCVRCFASVSSWYSAVGTIVTTMLQRRKITSYKVQNIYLELIFIKRSCC